MCALNSGLDPHQEPFFKEVERHITNAEHCRNAECVKMLQVLKDEFVSEFTAGTWTEERETDLWQRLVKVSNTVTRRHT